MSKNKEKKKEVRKPISDNYAPKRLAINFEPPTMSTIVCSQLWSIWQWIQGSYIIIK